MTTKKAKGAGKREVSRERTDRLEVRFTDDERAELESASKRDELPTATWARRVLLRAARA